MSKSQIIRQKYRVEPVWSDFCEQVNSLDGVDQERTRLRFRRENNSHRGLKDFTSLKELVCFTPNQAAIEEIANLQNLEYLHIDETRAKDLSPLVNCRSLRNLTIKGATQIVDIEWLQDLPQLSSFLAENIKKVTDISPLASLIGAKAIGIEGSMWTRQKVASFSALSNLTTLEALFITNCKPTSNGLTPLHDLENLRFLDAPAFYKEEEFLALEEANPNLKCSWFDMIKEHGSIKAAVDVAINQQD